MHIRVCTRSLAPDPSSACHLHLLVEWSVDPWPVEYQSCNLNNIVVQKQRLLCSAYCCNIRALLFLLDTDIFVSNLFRYPEILAYLCILFAVLLPIDPSPHSPFLQHSTLSCSESTLQSSKCCSQSVPPNLARKIPWTNTNSPGSLIGWTTCHLHQNPTCSSGKSNLS